MFDAKNELRYKCFIARLESGTAPRKPTVVRTTHVIKQGVLELLENYFPHLSQVPIQAYYEGKHEHKNLETCFNYHLDGRKIKFNYGSTNG